MQSPTNSSDQLAQFVAEVAKLSALVGDPALADRLGPSLVLQVQSVAAAVRQRFITPPRPAG
jgi:hypothetical protein